MRVLQRPSLHVEVATKFQHALPSTAGSAWPFLKSSALWVVLVSATQHPSPRRLAVPVGRLLIILACGPLLDSSPPLLSRFFRCSSSGLFLTRISRVEEERLALVVSDIRCCAVTPRHQTTSASRGLSAHPNLASSSPPHKPSPCPPKATALNFAALIKP